MLAFCLSLNDKQLLKNLWRKDKTLILNSKLVLKVSDSVVYLFIDTTGQ
ncbi:hypothetical protein AQPE_2825 [Aquipluma nitroreducens]|uniref:Uncharacterized protein n=1 Tax=Aquipluma nitroreducens TaxID=2010828 RepID=A0A5K7SAS2_9BACT|nr:hypothetical protein AQPE_2825 [Aquipluma nitroreducens]